MGQSTDSTPIQMNVHNDHKHAYISAPKTRSVYKAYEIYSILELIMQILTLNNALTRGLGNSNTRFLLQVGQESDQGAMRKQIDTKSTPNEYEILCYDCIASSHIVPPLVETEWRSIRMDPWRAENLICARNSRREGMTTH